jgi:predicted RNase H-like HicB family nuclease
MPLPHYLGLEYPFHAIADADGGYTVIFPDLPGCLTQVGTVEETGPAAAAARRLWITTEYEAGDEIPLPSHPEEYRGKFQLRIPRSPHRRLGELAESEGVSLNQCVVTLLARSEAESRGASPSSRRPVAVRGPRRESLRRVASGG